MVEQKAENVAAQQAADERAAAYKEAVEAQTRREDFQARRHHLRSHKGYYAEMLDDAGHRAEVDRWVDARLVEEGYGDLLEQERQQGTDRQRELLREQLSGTEDYASLSDDRKAEVDASVEAWLIEETAAS
jgi:hypothetical protein